MSAKATGADTGKPNGDTKHRQHNDGSSGRAFTHEQKAAVIRIRRCAPTAFYEILGLEEVKTTCSDGEIKKAYRKLSLLTHPDKNGFEGADEAFKLVSRAFQVLSDPDKKSKYDRFGGDPDNRFGGGASAAGASPFSNFARSGGAGAQRGQMWEEEISPEEMFRQFFGGGGMGGGFGGRFGGGLFDTGPGFVFDLGGGGPGIRVHQFGGGRPRRRPGTAQPPGQEQPPNLSSALSSLLPLLIFFALPLLMSLFNGSSPSGPKMYFDHARAPQTYKHTTSNLKIPYWVDPKEVEGYSTKNWRALDKDAEHKYVHYISVQCEREKHQQQIMIDNAEGWFFRDEARYAEALRMQKPNCDKARKLGMNI